MVRGFGKMYNAQETSQYICFKLIVTPLMFYLEKNFSHAFHLQAMPISLSDDQMIMSVDLQQATYKSSHSSSAV